MSKLGVSLKIDVTKIDKNKLFQGAKGTYLDATVFIDVEGEDQYGNHGMITQSVKQGEDKNSGAILGNCKIFWRDQDQSLPHPQKAAPMNQSMPSFNVSQPPAQQQAAYVDSFDDDIPFS